MNAIDENTAGWLRSEGNIEDWVLKNQGEGGGHCLFDEDILDRLDTLNRKDYSAWSLMQHIWVIWFAPNQNMYAKAACIAVMACWIRC